MSDSHEDIRKALAAGPTPGPWTASNRGSYGVSDGDEGSVYGPDGEDIGAEFVKPIGNMPTIRGELWYRDAVFVAACNPEAIAALLADRDRLAAALAASPATPGAVTSEAELPAGKSFVEVFYASKPDKTDRWYSADDMRAFAARTASLGRADE